MAVQLTSVNGQLFGNNQPIGGTTGRQYLPTSDTNILINEDIAMTICNNNVNSTFNKLGGGANNTVNALAVDSTGNVYVGGDFLTVTNTDGSIVTVNRIAKWNPNSNTWSALGSGTNSDIYALSVYSNSNNLYVGGYFTYVNDISANRIAKILPDTIINISINGNYLTTLISKQYQCLNYFKENSRIYKTFNGNL